MKRVLYAIAIALLVPMVAGAGPMKPGKWQISVETEMAGVAMKIPPVTTTECVTKGQAENPEPPKMNDTGTDCQVSDYKLEGNTVTWSIVCKKENLTGTGKITFNGDSYEGQSKMKMGDNDITQKLSGKLLGDCDK